MSDLLLVINAGSSSIKFSIFTVSRDKLRVLLKGQVTGIGTAPRFEVSDRTGQVVVDQGWDPLPAGQGHGQAFAKLLPWLNQNVAAGHIVAVGHRVVHGGPDMTGPQPIDESILTRIESLVPLMPLHLPHNLTAIRAILELRPDLPQVACFDTSFHRDLPEAAKQFGLPRKLYQDGIRRYGFHGISYHFISKRLKSIAPDLFRGRVIIAHLGSGASMCALKNGKSVDTTMGFSALDGLPMGTRCGGIDPGVLLYLLGQKGLTLNQLENLLYRQSGLLGLSGLSNDMRLLIESNEPAVNQAIDFFVYRVNRELGALTAVLGGLDGLVFTAGIGENSSEIRSRVCAQAAWLGIEIDQEANLNHRISISKPGSSPRVFVIPTDEARLIAALTLQRLTNDSSLSMESLLSEEIQST